MAVWLQFVLISVLIVILTGLLFARSLPVWVKVIFAVVDILAIALLVVLVIATTKDMGFIDYIKTWFEKTSDIVEPVEDVVEETISTFRN